MLHFTYLILFLYTVILILLLYSHSHMMANYRKKIINKKILISHMHLTIIWWRPPSGFCRDCYEKTGMTSERRACHAKYMPSYTVNSSENMSNSVVLIDKRKPTDLLPWHRRLDSVTGRTGPAQSSCVLAYNTVIYNYTFSWVNFSKLRTNFIFNLVSSS